MVTLRNQRDYRLIFMALWVLGWDEPCKRNSRYVHERPLLRIKKLTYQIILRSAGEPANREEVKP